VEGALAPFDAILKLRVVTDVWKRGMLLLLLSVVMGEGRKDQQCDIGDPRQLEP
jgi:hypothetical protein